MGDQTVNKKILVIPTALFELPSLKVMRLIDESEALREIKYISGDFDFRALISIIYLIFYSFLKSTIFLLFISRKHSYFKTHSCAQRLITSFSRDSFRYFKCCILNSIFRSVFSRIADSGGNLDTLFFNLRGPTLGEGILRYYAK